MERETNHAVQLSRVKDYYNVAQKYYERIWYRGNRGLGLHYGFWTEGAKGRVDALLQENEILAYVAKIKPGDMVLDAGCGVGGSAIWLAKNKGAKVIGLNIVRGQLEKGQKLSQEKVPTNSPEFIQADYQHLPFKGAFDVFWFLESIEHSDDVRGLIEEAFVSLKPGGRAVIAGTFRGSREPNGRQKRQLDTGFRAAGAFNDFHSAEEVATFLEQGGFGHIQNIDTTNFVMKSAKQMQTMCQLALPGAKTGHRMGIISQIMVDNTAWGTYQAGLFENKVTSYNVLIAQK